MNENFNQMKKSSLLMLLCAMLVFAACEKDMIESEPFIPVAGITMDESMHTIALTVAENKTLKVVIVPDQATNQKIVWSSDDEKIATVSVTGVVTGMKAGSTKVWAKSVEDSSIMDVCVVMVTETIIDITEVILDSDKLTVEIDQTKPLSVMVVPEHATNRNVIWESSDKTIATVSQTGNVTGFKVGTTTITVTSDMDPEKSATCEVTVTEKSIPATDMWMKNTQLELKVGENKSLDAVTIPTNATDQTMVWSSDDEAVATVNAAGVVTGMKAGTTIIWVKWGLDNSIKDKCTVTVLAESSYMVGDLYPDVKHPIGVVFWKDPANPAKGKIVSLIETEAAWAKEAVQRNALDENDGMKNMKIIKSISGWADLYPAFSWCSNRGSEWYLPAISEMKEVYKRKDVVNEAIIAASVDHAVVLDDNKDYWTSTERALTPQGDAVMIQFYKGFGGGGAPAGGISFNSKDGRNNVRAIMKF